MNSPSAPPFPRLRPMGLGDILDAVFRIYRRDFLTFVGIVAVLQVPIIILQLLLTAAFGQSFANDLNNIIREIPRFNPSQDSFNELPLGNIMLFYVGSASLAIVQGLVIQQLIQGALTNAVAQRYLGQPTSIGSAYRGVLQRLGSLLGAAVLVGLISLGVLLVMGTIIFLMAFLAGATFSNGGTGAAVGGVLAILFGIFAIVALFVAFALLVVRFSFFTQAIVVEGQQAVGGLRRSWLLVRGSYWRIVGIIFMLSLLIYIIVGIPSGIAGGIIGLIFPDPSQHFIIRQTLTTLISYLAQIIVLPIQLITYTLLYFDLRVRNEGYDLELMTQQMHTAPGSHDPVSYQ